MRRPLVWRCAFVAIGAVRRFESALVCKQEEPLQNEDVRHSLRFAVLPVWAELIVS